MIGFITEANREVGYGHLYRSLAIAQLAKNHGHDICFIVGTQEEKDFLEDKIDNVNIKGSSGIGKAFLQKERINFLFIDVYHKNFGKFAHLENLEVVSGTIIDAAFAQYALDSDYIFKIGFQDYQRKIEINERGQKPGKVFSGRDFFIFREEFTRKIDYKCAPEVSSLLVTMGGSDPAKLTEFVLHELIQINYIPNITVILGSGFPEDRLHDLKKLSEKKNITILQNISNISEVMAKSDLAIINGGNTRYELATIGVPFLSIAINEKQRGISDRVAQEGVGKNIGVQGQLTAEDFQSALEKFSSDFDARKRMSCNMKQLIKPCGAQNILGILEDDHAI